ncbi:MAG: MFS transporter [Polyangiaceae bacterium]|nr:MFS transporter [Polyangiaceae bacterium]
MATDANATASPARFPAVPTANPARERPRDRVQGKFAAMAAAYCLGVFNDSFYKQSCMLIAVGLGLTSMQGAIAIVFILPYLVVSAPAGWLADRFPKRYVVIATKGLELLAMVLGALGVVLVSWPLVLAMAFTMGLQSCLFSPALNGSVPELFPPAQVTPANSVLKAVMVAAVLLGIALAGITLETGGALVVAWLGGELALTSRVLVAVTVVGVALVGVVTSLATPTRPAAAPTKPFPWTGPLDTLRELRSVADDRLLLVATLLGTFVWTVGSLQAMLVNPLGKLEFRWGDTATSGLLAAEMVGVAVGGGLAGALARRFSWERRLVPALVTMAGLLASLGGLWLVPDAARYGVTLTVLFASGVAGGLVLVPCEAHVQLGPPAERRGAVLSAYGFLFGLGVVVSGLLANLLNALVAPTLGFVATAALTLGLATVVAVVLRREDQS